MKFSKNSKLLKVKTNSKLPRRNWCGFTWYTAIRKWMGFEIQIWSCILFWSPLFLNLAFTRVSSMFASYSYRVNLRPIGLGFPMLQKWALFGESGTLWKGMRSPDDEATKKIWNRNCHRRSTLLSRKHMHRVHERQKSGQQLRPLKMRESERNSQRERMVWKHLRLHVSPQ